MTPEEQARENLVGTLSVFLGKERAVNLVNDFELTTQRAARDAVRPWIGLSVGLAFVGAGLSVFALVTELNGRRK